MRAEKFGRDFREAVLKRRGLGWKVLSEGPLNNTNYAGRPTVCRNCGALVGAGEGNCSACGAAKGSTGGGGGGGGGPPPPAGGARRRGGGNLPGVRRGEGLDGRGRRERRRPAIPRAGARLRPRDHALRPG